MRRVDLTLEPEGSFPVPTANGYQIYGAILSALDDVDEDVSTRVHDSSIGSLTNSGLLGSFNGSKRDHHKLVIGDKTYDLRLGVADPRDQEVFQALADAFVFSDDTLELADGDFRVRDFASTNTTHAELLEDASEIVGRNHDTFETEICFETPTCVKESSNITNIFPARQHVFASILRKWNATIPDERADEFNIAMTREDFGTNLIEKPDADTYETHTVLVNRGENGGPILRQGFTTDCTYKFKDASEAIRTAMTSLALFSEYAGVGAFVSRGCGTVSVEVEP